MVHVFSTDTSSASSVSMFAYKVPFHSHMHECILITNLYRCIVELCKCWSGCGKVWSRPHESVQPLEDNKWTHERTSGSEHCLTHGRKARHSQDLLSEGNYSLTDVSAHS